MRSARSTALASVLAALVEVASLLLVGCDSAPTTTPNLPAATTQSAADPTATVTAAAAASAAKPKLRPGAQTKVLEKAGDRPFDKTFDDLRFPMQPGEPFRREMLTKPIEELAGTHIRIRGYILPTPQKRGIKQFVLVRDNQECCFGQGAALFDCILVEMQEGKSAEFMIRPVAVSGTFEIQEFKGPDGTYLAIYHLAGEAVE